MHTIIVFSKTGCHLCERAIENLKELLKVRKFNLQVVDITRDESLLTHYFLKIPVVRLDGRDVLEAEDIALPKDSWAKLENLIMNLKD